MWTRKNLIILLIILLLAGGLFVYFKNRKSSQPQVTSVPTSLTAAQQNQFQQNIDRLMKIVNNPDSTKADKEGAWLQIGINYESLGRLSDEKNAFLKASETDPNSFIPWSNLGTLYIEMKDYSAAREAFQKALALDKNEPAVWLKWINFNRYQEQASDSQIRQLFNDSYGATNNNDMLLRQGATYLEDTKDYRGALAAWQAVLKQYPNDAAVKAEIARLQALLKTAK